MKASAIRPDQVLMLKRNNPYGFTGDDLLVRVAAVRCKDGYLTPWVYDSRGNAFRPSDFATCVGRS